MTRNIRYFSIETFQHSGQTANPQKGKSPDQLFQEVGEEFRRLGAMIEKQIMDMETLKIELNRLFESRNW